jgi:predicted nucleotide-binding protein (sugar kinase/HSP70/actin superfamily)
MKIMLPYYNDLTVLLATVFNELGFVIDYTGRPGKETIDITTKYSPESWCYDAKLILGQAIDGIKRKDDIISIPGAWGGKGTNNCFLGYLTKEVLEKKLKKLTGKNANIWFFNVNPAEIMMSGYTKAYKNFSMLKKYSKINFFRSRLMKAILLGTKKMKMAADLKEIILSSPEVVDKKKIFLIYDLFIEDMIFKADTLEKSNKIFHKALNEIKSLKREK